MKKGDLIRVKPSAEYFDADFMREEGVLWVVTRQFVNKTACYAKSLISGSEYVWFEEEFEYAEATA